MHVHVRCAVHTLSFDHYEVTISIALGESPKRRPVIFEISAVLRRYINPTNQKERDPIRFPSTHKHIVKAPQQPFLITRHYHHHYHPMEPSLEAQMSTVIHNLSPQSIEWLGVDAEEDILKLCSSQDVAVSDHNTLREAVLLNIALEVLGIPSPPELSVGELLTTQVKGLFLRQQQLQYPEADSDWTKWAL
ncbi:hypothetical protein BCR39DRAFT_37071 [Naematelia encephala]|uniref:Uncharacterized protein n=1 Tax=Naematelia encephala TaxID=71784 RepID=A0A1Y2BMF3_9TREE|nr:hypothetical protein BCR39DRAFT_37071 [Naematelia encephala]